MLQRLRLMPPQTAHYTLQSYLLLVLVVHPAHSCESLADLRLVVVTVHWSLRLLVPFPPFSWSNVACVDDLFFMMNRHSFTAQSKLFFTPSLTWIYLILLFLSRVGRQIYNSFILIIYFLLNTSNGYKIITRVTRIEKNIT